MSHIATRTCVGCRGKGPSSAYFRLSWDENATAVILNEHGRLPGRGAYICKESSSKCLNAAIRTRSLARSLRIMERAISFELLQQQLNATTKEV